LKILCVFGRYNYGDPARGEGYEYANFIPALRALGHELILFDSWNKAGFKDFSDLNRQLLCLVDGEKPDVVFFVTMTCEIWLETLQLIREGSDAALLHWNPDDSWKYEQSSRLLASGFDLMATTYTSAMLKSGQDGLNNFVLTQWAANSGTFAEPLPASQCRYPVSFIGSAYGNRPEWVALLKEQGIDVECFGYGWPKGPVASADIPRIYRQSVVSLNFADSGVVLKGGKPARSRQIKARVFEVPGAGGLLATEDAEGLELFFDTDKEILVFEGVEGLAEKIHSLLSNPDIRDAMAAAGHARTFREHGYEQRFSSLLEEAMQRRRQRATGSGMIDFPHFEILAEAHRPHSMLKVLKWILSWPCMLLWGKKRGLRAARRFLFEISWRLIGRRVYTAAAWPGRIFYHES